MNHPKAFCLSQGRGAFHSWPVLVNVVLGLALLVATVGCQTTGKNPQFGEVKDVSSKSPSLPAVSPPPGAANAESLVLREGDNLKITFLGAPNLNTTVAVRRDGKINLYLVGEVKAAGLTPGELEKELKKLYKDQITVNEITVAVESDSFPIYVTGAVLHPQKVMSNHPITIIEAIMEAGGPDYSKANLKKVVVLRPEGGNVKQFILNVKDMLTGKGSFYMKPGDTIIIHEKFSWL